MSGGLLVVDVISTCPIQPKRRVGGSEKQNWELVFNTKLSTINAKGGTVFDNNAVATRLICPMDST